MATRKLAELLAQHWVEQLTEDWELLANIVSEAPGNVPSFKGARRVIEGSISASFRELKGEAKAAADESEIALVARHALSEVTEENVLEHVPLDELAKKGLAAWKKFSEQPEG